MTAPQQTWEIPHPQTLTTADLDEVLELTGVDIMAAQGNLSMGGRVLAALVCWVRNRAGETVTFDEVYRTLVVSNLRVTGVDPTQPPTG